MQNTTIMCNFLPTSVYFCIKSTLLSQTFSTFVPENKQNEANTVHCPRDDGTFDNEAPDTAQMVSKQIRNEQSPMADG